MELLFKEEVKNEKELGKLLSDKKIDVNYSTAVIALITDSNGRVLLQRRGPKSRDDNNKLADIGGAVETSDVNFREALKRELKEEVGSLANIKIENFLGGVLKTKFDPRRGENVNWLFLVYKCLYVDGELLINEEGKCLGYEFFAVNELPLEEMLDTTKYFWNIYTNLEK